MTTHVIMQSPINTCCHLYEITGREGAGRVTAVTMTLTLESVSVSASALDKNWLEVF